MSSGGVSSGPTANRNGGSRVNTYETIGIVLGVVIFTVILIAAVLVARKEHA